MLLNSSLCPLPAPVYAIVKVSPVIEVEIPVPPDTVKVSVPLFAVVVPESATNVSKRLCVDVLIVNVSLAASVVTVIPLPTATEYVSVVVSALMLDCTATAIVPKTFHKVSV